MPRKVWIGLAVIGVLLLAVIYLQTGNRGFNTLDLPSMPKLAADGLARVEIGAPSGKIELALADKTWRIVSPYDFPAEEFRLDALRRAVAEVRVTDLIAESSSRDADFGLNSGTAVHLVVKGAKGQTLDLLVGRVNPAGTHTFVRVGKRPGVYQVLGDLATPLAPQAGEWRSLKIYDRTPDEIKEFGVVQGNRSLTARKRSEVQPGIVPNAPQGATPTALPARTVWMADGVKQPLSEPKVQQFLNNLARMTAARIVDEPVPAGKPIATVRFATGKETAELEFLAALPKAKRYRVRKAGETTVYEIEDYLGQSLLKTAADLK